VASGGKNMSEPYTQTNITENIFERIFDLSVDNEELVWHRDRRTRFVKVLEGVGWKFQFDNQLPKEIGPGSTIHINKFSYPRLLKCSTPLKVRIVEL
jgi:quercetin dioxygenase-like cupin family protein